MDMTSPKRMRLGTKSCAECRRRKIRCIFQTDQAICEACTLHGVTCVAQQKGKPASNETSTSDEAMRQRLEELELQVQQLSRSNDLQTKASPGARSYASISQPSPFANHLTPGFTSTSISSPEQDSPRSDLVNATNSTSSRLQPALDSAPLVHLLRDSSLISIDNSSSAEPLKPFMAESRITSICEAVVSLMPSSQHLDLIFAWTEKFWPVWPPCSYSKAPLALLGTGKSAQAKEMMQRGLSSSNAGFAAKITAWLALCIQQTSRAVVAQVQLSMPQSDLVNVYLNLIRSLLDIDADAGGSLDGVACMLMMYKLYINMGRPHKAWYWTRQAVSAAVNLGLHQRTAEPQSLEAMLWTASWTNERFMAHLLGMPSSVSSVHAGISLADSSSSALDQVRWHLATATGKIIDRDQLSQKSQYSTTVQISQELEEAKDLIPHEWWLPSAQQAPIADLFARQHSKIVYFVHMKLLHLPFMLRSVKESKYRHSWDTAMSASRGAVEAYIFFREAQYADADLCQLMDFSAFSCAMVLIIGHMICPDRAAHEAKESDWQLIETALLCLRKTAVALECPVALQAAQTLEVLNAARRGGYVSQEDYTVVIPYFGKVRINPHMATAEAAQKLDKNMQSTMPNVLEFSTHEFLTDGFWPVDAGLELEANWMDMPTFDLDVDWGQVFTSLQ